MHDWVQGHNRCPGHHLQKKKKHVCMLGSNLHNHRVCLFVCLLACLLAWVVVVDCEATEEPEQAPSRGLSGGDGGGGRWWRRWPVMVVVVTCLVFTRKNLDLRGILFMRVAALRGTCLSHSDHHAQAPTESKHRAHIRIQSRILNLILLSLFVVL